MARRQDRTDRCSLAVSLVGAAVAFPVFLCVAFSFLSPILIGAGFLANSRAVILVIAKSCLLVGLAAALFLSRRFFLALRWKKSDDGSYCLKCDYNLTGNVSGICPECGEALDLSHIP